MKNKDLAKKIKELRNRKGMSQEILAEESGLSLRTIQRIEKSKTEPTGDTLKRLSNALNVTPDELIDWTIKEDRRFLKILNLSALTYVFFPILGILVPFILWILKKDKLKDINKVGKDIVNFEITWTILLFFIPLISIIFGITEEITWRIIINSNLVFLIVMYIMNFIFIIFNTFRIHNKKDIKYYPKIIFLRL
ncbi:transcriptional regulator with XRE-family HTH domain [Aquimarina sp. EL_43]|uniref:helix-turn-helix domain-containing protein n=1 Tax=unclassified Aquimarina TaxID=2627091 RepID=UPI0018C942D4|nr:MULTISPECIES: helix-turn-helix domain-containing protein [unclassified Aquimarina]MBG6129514.1 transcriptional regulator with XRE-family HTH domain [Aquimarina sp. EL_35]MBG6150579.1 transcriptional regulator with XRE-family HTH domain [Aquimarina sp. EL_32]MBG6168113.1 transcriptional regulator with XRE-family HTH domain [Aquimarina sp. EL_43]